MMSVVPMGLHRFIAFADTGNELPAYYRVVPPGRVFLESRTIGGGVRTTVDIRNLLNARALTQVCPLGQNGFNMKL